MNKDISFEDVRKKLDAAPEGYVPKEYYEVEKMRADRLEEMWRAEHNENKRFRKMYDKICKLLVNNKEDEDD